MPLTSKGGKRTQEIVLAETRQAQLLEIASYVSKRITDSLGVESVGLGVVAAAGSITGLPLPAWMFCSASSPPSGPYMFAVLTLENLEDCDRLTSDFLSSVSVTM